MIDLLPTEERAVGKAEKNQCGSEFSCLTLRATQLCCWVTRSRDTCPALIEELNPKSMWPRVSDGSTSNFDITST